MELIILHLLVHEVPILILAVVSFFTGRRFCGHTYRRKDSEGAEAGANVPEHQQEDRPTG